MPAFTASQDYSSLTITTPEIELMFSLDDGGLRRLCRTGGPNLIGYGGPCPSIDVRLGNQGWLAEHSFVRYLHHDVYEREGGVEIMIVIGIGSLKVYDRYRITGTLIARRASIENVGLDELQLRGVRLLLPWVQVGESELCHFEAPGNSVRPRLPLPVAAAQRHVILPRRFFTPGVREGRVFERVPSQGVGLLALHDSATDEALFCWYHSTVEIAHPHIDGNNDAVTLFHQIEVSDWLRPEVALTCGTQYILLLREPWASALDAFRRTLPICGVSKQVHPPSWVRDAAVYEVHPAQYGGFRGLAVAIPQLRAIGINTLCLLPIWDFANLKGRLWDGNWERSGNLYAIRSFEQLDRTLGESDDFRSLVDLAHQHGMRVLLDLPLMGCAIDSLYVSQHPDWFCYDEYGRLSIVPDQTRLVAFDWASPGLQEYLLGWALEHIRIYGFDGYRTMVPRTSQLNWARNLPYHASAGSLMVVRFLERLQYELKYRNADAILCATQAGPSYQANHDLIIDELPHHMFVHLAIGRVSPSELGEWLEDYERILLADAVRVCFTESHLTRLLNPLADGLRGSRISRMLLAGMVFCGFVPSIWSGQEQGEEDFIRQLLHIREQHATLRYGAALYNVVPCDSQQIFSVLRIQGDDHLLGLLNVGSHKQTVALSLPVDMLGFQEGDYELYELVSGSRWVEEGRSSWHCEELLSMTLTLEPFSAYCFSVLPVNAPPYTPNQADIAEPEPSIALEAGASLALDETLPAIGIYEVADQDVSNGRRRRRSRG